MTAAGAKQEAQEPTWVRHKPEFEQIAWRLENSNNPFFGTLQVPRLRRQLSETGLPNRDALQLHMDLCWHQLRLGDVSEAVEQIDLAAALAESMVPIDEKLSLMVQRFRALTYLRQAEVSNCIQRHNRDCCIFPLRRGGVHDKPNAARQAQRSLLAALESNPDDLVSRWLANIVAMALRDYPLAHV